jgi:hypothetical protein
MLRMFKMSVLTLLIITVVFTALVVELSPAVVVSSSEQVNKADTVQALLDDLRESLRSRYEAQKIYVSADQANSLAGFLNRALDPANAQVNFLADKVLIAGSYEIRTSLLSVYINIEALIVEGDALQVDLVTIGDLPLPGGFALSLAESLINYYTSSLVATKAINTINSLTIENNAMLVNLAPIDTLLREFKNIKTGGSREDARILKIRIAHYLRLLDGIYVAPLNSNAQQTSLSMYLHAVMKEAAVMSENGSATLENEAAILALAIYAGSPRFTDIIGDLSFAIDRIPYAWPKPVLVNRQDLSLHFVFSAAIKLLSQKGISIAVGEFKELMDRGQGGSGYSFIDLAADLSGTNFAALAVNPKTAQRLQTIMLGEANETLFMVPVIGLDEGLSKVQFTEQYGEVDSVRYRQIVDDINARITKLPISL